MIRLIENMHFTCWHACNVQSLAHLPMLFVGKLHQFFQHLASFSPNSINTNLVEHGNQGKGLNIKSVSTAIKLASKFLKKMTKHIEDNTIPKEVPAFAHTLFVEQPGGSFTNAPVVKKTAETPAADGKGKKDGDEPKKERQKRKASDKSLKMGIFHIKQSINATLALPEKGKLKVSICLDFCAHGKSATPLTCFAKTASTTPPGRTSPMRINWCYSSTCPSQRISGLTLRHSPSTRSHLLLNLLTSLVMHRAQREKKPLLLKVRKADHPPFVLWHHRFHQSKAHLCILYIYFLHQT
jgi:hypothetical protein